MRARQTVGTGASLRRRKVSAISTLLALGLALTACSGGEDSDADPADPADSRETVPAATGELDKVTWILEGEPATLDPIYDYAFYDNTVIGNMCEPVVRMNPDLSLTDSLATGEQVDPTTFTYTLKPGITFWDGSPATAEDLAYSLNRSVDPELGSYYGSLFTSVKEIVATDESTVTVTLKQPDPVFGQLAMVQTGTALISKKFAEQAGKDFGAPDTGVMCTGPYKFKSWTPGASIVMERNESYWNAETMAKTKEVEFIFRADSTAQANTLISGDAQGMYVRDPGIVERLRQTEGKVYHGGGLVYQWIMPTRKKGPMNDVDVRQALARTIDRDAIADKIFAGTATPIRGIVGPDTWGPDPAVRKVYEEANEQLPDGEVDIEAAKELFEKAGSPQETVTLAYPTQGGDYQLKLATVIQQGAEKIGLKMKLRPLGAAEAASLYQDPDGMAAAGIDLISIFFNSGGADPLDNFTTYDPSKDSVYNYSGYSDPELTQLIKDVVGKDPVERARLMTQMQEILSRDLPIIPLVAADTIVYLGEGVTGAPASFSQIWSPWANYLGSTS